MAGCLRMTLQVRYCGACRSLNRSDAQFCVSCGAASSQPVSDAALLVEEARAHAEHGDQPRARLVLEQALRRLPEEPSLRLALASVCLQSGDYDRGLCELDLLRTTVGAAPVIEAYRAGALMALGRISEAKDVLDAAYAATPDDFYVALKRGELFCRLGIYPTAIDELERALALGLPDAESQRAARALLRFAREKNRRGFVRRLLARRPIRRPAEMGVT